VPPKEPAEKVVKDIRRMTRRRFSAEDKIRIVLEGLRGEDVSPSYAAVRGSSSLYYRWSKDFLEAGWLAIRRGLRARTWSKTFAARRRL
jgi:transposase-like protein